MILYLTTEASSNVFRYLFRDWAWSLRRSLVRTTYEAVLRAGTIPRATIVFTDHERMSCELHSQACELWERVEPHCRALNDPRRVLGRKALLDRLFDEGINTHRAFPADAVPGDARFPLFLRGTHDHLGPRTGLLPDRAAFEEARAKHRSIVEPLAVEFVDASDEEGITRKFSAFRVAGAMIPKHLIHGKEWVVKVHRDGHARAREEERPYQRDNPHAEQLRAIFELAGIEYGRIDYGLADGVVRVWEINTNPTVMSDWLRMARWRRPLQREFVQRYRAALEAIDDTPAGPPIPLR